MPTHFLRFFSALQLLSLTLASTTYHCNSETAPKFHQDCAVAANQLILSLTRRDGQAHIPNDDVLHTFNTCQASVQSSGGEKLVPASALLLSYAQIGARCQDGSFSYEGGSVDGSLKGQANWKRTSPKDFTFAKSARQDQSVKRDAHIKRDMHTPKVRGPGSQMMGARKGYDGNIYEIMMVSAHAVPELVPTSPNLHSMFVERSREFLQHNFQREDNADLVFGNAYPIEGATHVSIASLGVSLRGGQKSWKEFVGSMEDNGKTLKELIADGIWTFYMKRYVAAYFRIITSTGDEVLSFIIYGYDSVDSALPK